MSDRRVMLRVSRSLLFAAVFASIALAQTARRPLTHRDYDGWRTISSQRLSPDGKWLAYGLFPQEGDGQVVIRSLVTGKEQREPAGVRPAPAPPSGAEEGPPPEARAVSISFSADSRIVVFSTFPSKADSDKAKREKKPVPKDGMVIVNLASGAATRIDRVKRFVLPEKASGWLAYHKEGPDTPAPAAPRAESAPGDQQAGGRGGRGAAAGSAAAGRGARPEFGSDLVLRNLADDAERTFSDVTEFLLAEDAKQLVFTVGAHDNTKNGLFVADVGSSGAPASLLAGKGKYIRPTWDEDQTQIVFLSDRDAPDAKPAKWKLYRWERTSTAAVELASAATPGFRPEFAISDRGTLNISKDGSRVYFAVARPAPERPAEIDPVDAEGKAVVDLWSYTDDYIQPIQKVRAERDRSRTFTAAYLLADKKVVQLADATLETVTPADTSAYVLGTDDREYRPLRDWDEAYSDIYLVDGSTGARKAIAKKHRGAATWSPDGKYLLTFDGKDWTTISVPDGKVANLTAAIPVKFWNEEQDTPSTLAPYGSAGWTKDGTSVLLYDKYDIWRVAPAGTGAKNLTAGYGRRNDLRLRYIRTEADNPRERWIDGSKPLMLQAENLKTWETGFYRAAWDGAEPKRLIMAPRSFSVPAKAKDADVYLLTGQSFNEFPDLLTTDATFREMRKVSDANPQKAQLTWGTSEVVRFKNADGVALTGALYKPENFDPAKKYPLMVYIYEKLTQNVNRFVNPSPGTSINISFYVSNGYLVLTPDIVYTVGFPGQSALKCVLPAIQAVVDRGFVDENAIGIQGHSWGGYQIAYMVTQTNRFRAAAAGAPVVNMISAYDGIRWGTGLPRQFQYERTQSRIGGSIWQYPTRFIENSPIFWMDRVQTPVMILQNDADDAVPWYQGIEFFLALRRLGKPAWMFNYNGQPHGLRNRADQKDYAIRLQQYFDHFLKGAPAPAWMEKGVPYIERERTALSELGAQ